MMKNCGKWLPLLLILLFPAMVFMPSFDALLEAYQDVEPVEPEIGSLDSANLFFEGNPADDGMVEILIYLKEQVDTAAVALKVKKGRTFSDGITSDLKIEIRRAVVDALQKNALRSQDPLLRYLEGQKNNGRVSEVKSYFILNLVYARVSAELIDEIAARPEVDYVKPNEQIQLVEPIQETTLPQIKTVEWNIDRVRAPAVWADGIDGFGVVVGIIDTGVDWQHVALKQQYRGYDPANPDRPNHAYNWFDPHHGSFYPNDWHGHGSHVTGIVLGADSAGDNQIGVAPGAQWIAARGLNNDGYGTADHLLAAGQYLLAPTPNPDGSGTPDPSKAPDIINNSWGSRAGQLNEWYRIMVQNWQAAGILPVFAAGNSGPDGGTIVVPANYPESFAVAATNNQNNLALFSSRGPSPYPTPDDMQPVISAPGVNICSVQSWAPHRERGYMTSSGTSMAAPHITGVAALLIHSDSSLTVDQLEAIMLDSAWPRIDKTYSDSPNYGYGYGLVNAFSAVVGEPPPLLMTSFDSGTWLYNAIFRDWNRYSSSAAIAMTHTDINKDGKLNFVGSYPSGTWYREGGKWYRKSVSTARELAYGDMTGDGIPNFVASYPSGTW